MKEGRLVSRVAPAARTVAALTVVALVARFAMVTVQAATESSPRPAPTPRAAASNAQPPPSTAAPRVSASGSVAQGTLIRTTVVVNVDPPRSEVSIDDAKVGRTPYLGDITCRVGEPVHVLVTLDRGAKLVFDRSCAPGTIHIEGSQ